MSIKVSTRVWQHSEATGSERLMLLAIADYADDEGRAFPSISTLARKCRTGERNAMYLLKALQQRGELRVHRGAGRNGTNLYQIVVNELDAPAPLKHVALLQADSLAQNTAPPQVIAPLNCAAPRQAGAGEVTSRGLTPTASQLAPDGSQLGQVNQLAVGG